jgi:hypothetical protein
MSIPEAYIKLRHVNIKILHRVNIIICLNCLLSFLLLKENNIYTIYIQVYYVITLHVLLPL